MIERIDISNFKSYKKASLPLAPLTVLIGANASGKSNALEAIRFLSWLAQGQKLSSLQYQVNNSQKVVRGRIKDLPRLGEDHFSLGCKINSAFNFTLNVGIRLRKDEDLYISEEKVQRDDGVILYESLPPSDVLPDKDLTIEYNSFSRGGRKPQIAFSDQLAIFTQLVTIIPSIKQKKARETLSLASEAFEKSLSPILLLDPNPASMREYSFLSEDELMGDGSNLSSVLYLLWNDPEKQDYNRKSILNFISSLPEQDIKSLDFLRGPREEVLISLTETFGGKETTFDASLLSDGTLRVLAIVAALLSAPPNSLVVFEEIGNGIHPSRATQILAEVDRIARDKGLSILISTHNPALLDSLPVSAIKDVVFCFRSKEDGGSKLINLEEIQDYPELIGQGSLGEILAKGLIEKYVKFLQDPEIKKEEGLRWLESFKNG